MCADVRSDLAEVHVVDAFDNQTISSTLGSDVGGPALDRKDDEYPQVAKAVLDGQGDLGDGSDELIFKLQHADDNGSGSPGSWSDTGETMKITNGDKRQVKQFQLDGKKRHVRLQLDSGSSTLAADAEVAGEFVLGGMKVIPQ